MGWLFMSRGAMGSFDTPKAYLDDQCTYPPDPEKGRETGLRVLKSTIRSGAYYAACQSYDSAAPRETFAIVCLVKWNPGARSGEEFGYKDQTETMGPYKYDCPASILDLLGPSGNDYAAEWRAQCRKRIALTSRRKPRPGDTLVLAEALTFTDGHSERTFRVVASGKKMRLCRMSDGVGVRITNLMSRAWTIVPPPVAPHVS